MGRPLWVELMSLSCLAGLLFSSGCESGQTEDPLDTVQSKIDSDEAVEQQILEIERTVRERDAAERIYNHLYYERDEILNIAQGNYNGNSPLHRALIREHAWIVLAELRKRRPEFEIRIETERKPAPPDSAPEKVDPELEEAIEKLPEEFK